MTSRQRRVLAVVSLGFFVVQLDLFIVNIAFPAIQRDFAGASLAGLSWVLNGYAIVYASLLVAAGRLADLAGRRRVFVSVLVVFTAASALCALAPATAALVTARLLQAVGAALVTPVFARSSFRDLKLRTGRERSRSGSRLAAPPLSAARRSEVSSRRSPGAWSSSSTCPWASSGWSPPRGFCGSLETIAPGACRILWGLLFSVLVSPRLCSV